MTEPAASLDEAVLLDQLITTTHRARHLVPGLVGVSIASRDHGLTFTLVATSEEIATLDAVQYIASGPCVDAVDLGHGIATPDGLLNEAMWQDFARASAAAGVHSTLTLPVLSAGEVGARASPSPSSPESWRTSITTGDTPAHGHRQPS